MNSSRAKRVRVGGPLGPYSEGFRTELAARGYEPSSAAGQLQVMAHLSRWLVDRGLDGHELTSSVVEEFLRARRVVRMERPGELLRPGDRHAGRAESRLDLPETHPWLPADRWRDRRDGRAG